MFFKDFLKKCANVIITAAVAGAGLGLVGGAAAGTFVMPAVGTAAGAIVGATAGAVYGAVYGAAAAFIDVFFGASSGTLMSAEDIDYPPTSTVLAHHGRVDLLDSMRSAVKTGNANAMDNIGKQLTKLGLDYISRRSSAPSGTISAATNVARMWSAWTTCAIALVRPPIVTTTARVAASTIASVACSSSPPPPPKFMIGRHAANLALKMDSRIERIKEEID